MRILAVLIVSALAFGLASCGGSNAADSPDAAFAWCAEDWQDINTGHKFSVDGAADRLEVDSIDDFLLEKAGITKGIDLGSLTEAEDDALSAVLSSATVDDLWREYLATPDGARACSAAFESANG